MRAERTAKEGMKDDTGWVGSLWFIFCWVMVAWVMEWKETSFIVKSIISAILIHEIIAYVLNAALLDIQEDVATPLANIEKLLKDSLEERHKAQNRDGACGH